MPQTIKLEVKSEDDLARLDHFLTRTIPEHSRSFWQKRIDAGEVAIDGIPAAKHGLKLSPGNIIVVLMPEPEAWHIEAEEIPLEIVYEDNEIIIINKPAGMTVHPGAGNQSGTLVNALLHHFKGSLSTVSGSERPGIVHRLDKDTSGLLVVARTDKAHRHLSRQFAEKTAGRVYEAMVWFTLAELNGRIETNLSRDKKNRKKIAVSNEGKPAVTNYRTLHNFSFCSHQEVMLETGRTHQIRVHMQHIGHPVMGDTVYGGGKKILNRIPVMDRKFAGQLLKNVPSLLLHARQLKIEHPMTGEEMTFQVQVPEYFSNTLKKLENRENNINQYYS